MTNFPKQKITNKVKVTNKVRGKKDSSVLYFKPSKETQKFLDLLESKGDSYIQLYLRKGMANILFNAVERSAALAPIKDGYLRASLKGDVDEYNIIPETTGGEGGEVNTTNPIRKIAAKAVKFTLSIGGKKKVIGVIKSDKPYAVKMHEGQYNLGPVSIKQPSDMAEGPVGNKFITRVVDYHAKDYSKELGEHIDMLAEEISKQAGIKK